MNRNRIVAFSCTALIGLSTGFSGGALAADQEAGPGWGDIDWSSRLNEALGEEGPPPAYGQDQKWVQPVDCSDNGTCAFSNLNSTNSRFIRYDDFICTQTGDISSITFWAAGWIGQSCDILQNLRAVEITIYEWIEGGPCGWEFGPVLCRNFIPVGDMDIAFECTSGGGLGLRNYRFDAVLPEPCFQEEGRQYAISIAADLIDPAGCYFCWTTTPEVRNCIAFSRTPGTEECVSQFIDQAFVLVTDPDPCADCPCPEDVNRDGQVDFGDILRLLQAWGPCCDDCEDGFVERCGGTDDCLECETPNGDCLCTFGALVSCDQFQICDGGDCPPGFFCCLNTCCPEPICMPLCDDRAPEFEPAEPGERTPSGVMRAPTFDLGAVRDAVGPAREVVDDPAVSTAAGPADLVGFVPQQQFEDGPPPAFGQDVKWQNGPYDCATDTCWFSTANSDVNPFVRWDDFVCTATGDITDFEFIAGGWLGGPCDLLSNLAGVRVVITRWLQDEFCTWAPGAVLCTNDVPLADLVIEPFCVDQFGIQQYRIAGTLPQPCPQTEGVQYGISIQGIVADPAGCFMCWAATSQPQLCLGYSDERGDKVINCISFQDMVYQLVTVPPDPCDDCPCPEDVNRDGQVDFGDILRLLQAWGPCCDDCEDGFVDRCGGTGECLECETPDGDCLCTFGAKQTCGDFRLCDRGECPPGLFCCLNTCCPEPICMPLCELGAPEFEPAEAGELTPSGLAR